MNISLAQGRAVHVDDAPPPPRRERRGERFQAFTDPFVSIASRIVSDTLVLANKDNFAGMLKRRAFARRAARATGVALRFEPSFADSGAEARRASAFPSSHLRCLFEALPFQDSST
jgi:hypothetical protein